MEYVFYGMANLFAWLFSWVIMGAPFFGVFSYLAWQDSLTDETEKTVFGIGLFVFVVGTVPLSAFLVHGVFRYAPPGLELRTTATPSPGDMHQALEALEQIAKGIEKAASDPKAMTLEEIEQLLVEALGFLKTLGEKTREQQKVIQSLRESVASEQKSAEESRRVAERLRSITREQLETVKFVITEDAREQSRRAFVYGAFVSLPIGILASVAAAFLYQRFLKRVALSFGGRKRKETADRGAAVDATKPRS